jgi:hypothetical protein
VEFSEVRHEFIANSSLVTSLLGLGKGIAREKKGAGMRRAMILLAAMAAVESGSAPPYYASP